MGIAARSSLLAVAAIASSLVTGCTSQRTATHEAPSLHRVSGDAYTIVASILPPRGVKPEFSFQGYLADAGGQPVTGPLNLLIGVAENTTDLPIEANDFPAFTTDDGRFDLNLPMPSPGVLLDEPDLFIAVIDADTLQDIVPRIPLLTVPRAGSAELARHARTADALTNQVTIDLPLAPEWSGGTNDFDIPRATRIGRLVVLSGLAVDIDGQLSPIVATLPFGFRPEKRLRVPALLTGPGAFPGQVFPVEFFTTGEIIIFNQPSFTPTGMHFNNISFVAAP
jgi:hypothetical protein